MPKRGEDGWLRDRAGLLHAVFLGLAQPEARRTASPAHRAVFYELGAMRAETRSTQVAFAREHFGDEVDFLLKHQLKGRGPRRCMTRRESRLARAWRLRARLAALSTLLDPTGRYGWWGHVFATIHTFAQAVDQYDRVYITKPYDRRSYVLATMLHRHAGKRVLLVHQSMPLYGNQRKLHVPVTAVVTSKVNVPEAEYFRRQGFFRASEIVYRSGEFVEEYASLEPAAPIYDIGFVASGDWARENGMIWARDIEQVRRGAFRGNVYERHSQMVLDALVGYARSRGRTLRIYMHPYERRLLHEHGIEPPYRGLADGELVSIDDAPGNSRGAFYEMDVAVALRSSVIWQRIDLGLERSFMYDFPDRSLGNLLAEALGEYRRNTFASVEDLYEKLDGCFAGQGDGAARQDTASTT